MKVVFVVCKSACNILSASQRGRSNAANGEAPLMKIKGNTVSWEKIS